MSSTVRHLVNMRNNWRMQGPKLGDIFFVENKKSSPKRASKAIEKEIYIFGCSFVWAIKLYLATIHMCGVHFILHMGSDIIFHRHICQIPSCTYIREELSKLPLGTFLLRLETSHVLMLE